MSNDEILDFINDEYFEENNDKIIEIVNKLITMEKGTKFSFEEIGISSKILMNKICSVCSKLDLILLSSENKEHNWSTVNGNGEFEKVNEIPAELCNVGDLIEKHR